MSDNERLNLPSASSWGRFTLCHGSLQMEQEARAIGQEAPRDPRYAEAGDRIHVFIDDPSKAPKLTESEENTASILGRHSQEQLGRIFAPVKPLILHEKRLWLHLDGQKVLSGRFDLCAYSADVALLQDFKTGWAEPDPAEDNAQMRVLAVLAAMALPKVKTVIVQLISGPYGVTEKRYTMAELGAAYSEIVATLKAINDPRAAITPSPAACKFCDAKLICQPFRDTQIRPVTRLQIAKLPIEGPRAAKLLDEVELLTGWIKAVKAYYTQLHEDPLYRIPGWGMAPGNIVREVTDWDTARARLGEFLDVKELKSAADYCLGDLEKALGKVLKLKDEALRAKMNEILKGLFIEKQNASSLKRIKSEPLIKTLTKNAKST